MKILALLEGTLKVPTEAYNQLMVAVCADVFSRIFTYLNSEAGDEYFDNLSIFKGLVAKSRKAYGAFDVASDYTEGYTTTHKIYVRMDEVDPRYLKRNPNAKGRTYTIAATISASGDADAPSGGYYKKKKHTAARLFVTVPSQATIEQVARAPELFDTMMHRIEGVAEHELMHSIQDMAFKEIPDEVDYYDANKEIINDKYYTNALEFSPQIISNSKDFVSYAKDLAAVGWKFDKEAKRALILNWVNPSEKPPRGIPGMTSLFFETLYNKDKAKWKKAVKYFYGLVQDKF